MNQIFVTEKEKVENFLKEIFPGDINQSGSSGLRSAENRLVESMNYSLLGGGKRFRPCLCLASLEALGGDQDQALPFAASLEMVHAYSLIHDDLPAMDDDDERRGEPTNHKVYGEAMAILAGDALLTESFSLLVKHYEADPTLAAGLVKILSTASGTQGMIMGQAKDIELSDAQRATADDLVEIHRQKTGALISACVEGAALLANVESEKQERLKNFGLDLGLSFQIADDLLDYDPESPEASSLPALLGLDETKKSLEHLTGQLLSSAGELFPALKTY